MIFKMKFLVLYNPNKVLLFFFFQISRNFGKCVNLSGVNLSGRTVYQRSQEVDLGRNRRIRVKSGGLVEMYPIYILIYFDRS